MPVPYMIAMHMADQDDVYLAQARIIRTGNGSAGIIQHAGTVRIFQNHGTIEGAEFTVVTAERRNLDISGDNRLCTDERQAG
jgi:hypothetical protein